jgi:phenylpyruvate tautomerase PptA (4-oxalocrotonate tautomerase family)
VRIDIKKNPDATFAQKLGKVVYASMKKAINVPDKDNFQVLTEHDDNHFVYDPAYLGIQRTDGVVFIQITLNEGRSTEQKKLLYQTIAEGLNKEAGVRLEDVFISLVEVKKKTGHSAAALPSTQTDAHSSIS